jgi:timeless
MLFNINMILVLEQILNGESDLLSFGARLMTNFGALAKGNPLLYVDSLFRQPVPHRFGVQTTNNYVNEELRMIAERELLMEEHRRMLDEEEEKMEDDEEEPRDTGATLQPHRAPQPFV